MSDKIYYHFTGKTLRDGQPIPPIGVWLEHPGEIIMCQSGLHASRHPFDALTYAPGEFLHRVRLAGKMQTQDDKVVAQKRLIVASLDATDLLRRFARSVALEATRYWKAPDVVLDYLKTGSPAKRSAARSAAWSAAGSAAWSAAGSVAESAAWSAAESAAESAARSVAESAAWSAAESAAWSVAESAAWSAAWSAARSAQRVQFAAMVTEEFARQVKP